jgi:hypothetical protein
MEELGEARGEAVRVAHRDGRRGYSDTFTHVTSSLCSRSCCLSSVHPCSSSLGILRADELTHLIIFSRLALFTTCRKFIDKSLYNELKQISQLPLDEAPVELDTLPSPSITSKRRSTNDTLHSLLSKTLFSLCFSESCTLFLLLMCQALDALDTR